MSDNDEKVPLTEATRLLGLPYHEVWRRARDGDLGEVEKVAGQLYLERAAIERFIRSSSLEEIGPAALETIGRFHLCGVQIVQVRETIAAKLSLGEDVAALEGQVSFLQTIQGGLLRQIDGDRREALEGGNEALATALATFLRVCHEVTYHRDSDGRWRIFHPLVGESPPALAPQDPQ